MRALSEVVLLPGAWLGTLRWSNVLTSDLSLLDLASARALRWLRVDSSQLPDAMLSRLWPMANSLAVPSAYPG